MKRKIIYLLLILLSIVLMMPIVEAAKPAGYYKRVSGGCDEYPSIPGFCIQSGVDYNRTKTYYNCDAGLSCFQAAAAYYGAIYNTNDYWGAQSILNGKTFYTNSSCTTTFNDATSRTEAYAYSYCTTPSLGYTSLNLTVGETKSFADASGVLSGYSVNTSSSAISVSKSGNTLYVTALAPVTNATITFYKGSSGAIIGHCSNESQNYVTVEAAPYVSSVIYATAVAATPTPTPTPTPIYGSFQITKVDNNNIPLQGVKFKIGTNLSGTENSSWKYYYTNASGVISISSIPVGSGYYYQEVEALEGYSLDSSINYVYIGSQTAVTKTVKNYPEETGVIKITKINQYDDRLNNVKFKIGTNLSGTEGTDWDYYYTDRYGEIIIGDLELGEYFAKEEEALPGYSLDTNTYRLILNEENQLETLTIRNVLEVDRMLKIVKRDTQTYETLSGVRINIYQSDGTLYQEKVTDENGEIYISDIEDGSYYLEEIEAPTGYVKLDGRYQFEISEGMPTLTIELFNEIYNPKTGKTSIIIPFATATLLLIGGYLVLKKKQKFI